MPEESTTPDLVERWRQAAEAADRRDFDATMGIFAPDAVWEVQPLGISESGPAAIRRRCSQLRKRINCAAANEFSRGRKPAVNGRYQVFSSPEGATGGDRVRFSCRPFGAQNSIGRDLGSVG